MSTRTLLAWGFLVATVFVAAGLASCSNSDERPMDTYFPTFPRALPRSPVGLIVTDPVFRQREPDPVIEQAYLAADLRVLTSEDLWNHFKSATNRIDMVGTRITNANTVSLLVGLANKGVTINIVCEKGYFGEAASAQYISELTQTGRVTIKTDDDGVARQVHSRYAIIDDHIVLASSGDFLDDTFNTAVNNTLVMDQPRKYVDGGGAAAVKTITDAFLFDFDQMFRQGKFGGDKQRLDTHTFDIGCKVEVYFGPNDNLLAEIADEINNLQANLFYMINQVTDLTMLSIIRSYALGGFYDGPSNPDYWDEDHPQYLPVERHIPFGLVQGAVFAGYNSLNHKVMLIDMPSDVSEELDPMLLDFFDPVVVSGSGNWTQNGLNLNDEQYLVIHDLTLGYEFSIEFAALEREAFGIGVVFGRVRTYKNVPVEEALVMCDCEAIPGGVFNGEAISPEDETDLKGRFALFVNAGRLRNIRVDDLGVAAGAYLLPDPLWGEDLPNQWYNLLPGSSYEANFYVRPVPSQTGTGYGGGGGGGGWGGG